MKWFKHIADSLDDPDIHAIVSEFGGDGYLVFFGCLEVLARNWNQADADGNLSISVGFLRKKLQISERKLRKIFRFPVISSRISAKFSQDSGGMVTLNCPKMLDLMDEWSRRQLGSHSGATPRILGREVEVDKRFTPPILHSPPKGGRGGKRTRKVFVQPSVEQVEEYCRDRNNGISAQAFMDHYQTVGWVVGKARTPMKDWQAAVRTWEERRKGERRSDNPITPGKYDHLDNPPEEER